MIGNELAEQFFLVDRVTGDVKLKTSLLQDPAKSERYQVNSLGWCSTTAFNVMAKSGAERSRRC